MYNKHEIERRHALALVMRTQPHTQHIRLELLINVAPVGGD